jgi:enamine deaminase RidA (YjgF/YER057c/UK114 family)
MARAGPHHHGMRLFTLLLSIAALAAPFTSSLTAGTPEERLAALGHALPASSPPVANYVPAVRVGDLVFLAGHIPRDAAGKFITGRVPTTISVDVAREAARQTALALLGSLKAEIGELDRVKRIVRVEGFVASADDFTAQPTVINGCSDLLVEVFGDRGRHARMAIGVNTLPLGVAVEIAMIVQVE